MNLQGLKAMTLRAPFMKILITTSWAVVPEYIDWDPRDDKEEWKDYTINLLTLVSVYEGDTITIMWAMPEWQTG